MNIVQSFYQIDNKTCYNIGENNNYLVNFYSLLLSYITLKSHYNNVIMYCNDFAYDKMLKYIPYDIIVKEKLSYITSENYRNEWGLLKFHVFEQQKEPFIHIDGDVFLFKNSLLSYMNNDNYDGIIQSIEINSMIYDEFYFSNKEKLIEYDFIDYKLTEESYAKYSSVVGYNNGVVGFKNLDALKSYIESAKKMNELINGKILINAKHQTMIFEQYLLYVLSQKIGLKMYEVLPTDDIINIGHNETGNKYGYTHLLSGNKYVGNFVMLIRNKIMRDYPEYSENIRNFEKSISGIEFIFLKHRNEDKLMKNIVNQW